MRCIGFSREPGIVMLGTSPNTMGGISSVVRIYEQEGLLDRYRVRYLSTHRDGGKGAKLSIHARAWLTFMGLLARGRVGLVHVHLSTHASLSRKCTFIAPARLLQKPVILHLHTDFEHFYAQDCGPIRRQIFRWVLGQAACIITLSSRWKSWVRQISRNPNVEVVHNPVVIPPCRENRTREPNTVLTLGRLCHGKGTYDLLEAAALLRQAGQPISLRLAGDGDLAEVAVRAESLNLEVALLGWINAEARHRELGNAAVYALPSYTEGLPMSLLEAMAAGLPVVTTPVGGIPDAVTDGQEGYLIKPGEISALADRLATLLNDPELAETLGANARAKAKEFSAGVTLPMIEAIYRRFGFEPT